jgi:hypothetical protein
MLFLLTWICTQDEEEPSSSNPWAKLQTISTAKISYCELLLLFSLSLLRTEADYPFSFCKQSIVPVSRIIGYKELDEEEEAAYLKLSKSTSSSSSKRKSDASSDDDGRAAPAPAPVKKAKKNK